MIRIARIDDVPAIHELINTYAEMGRMMFRSQAEIYESLRDFMVYEHHGRVVGCGGLHIFWADLAEIKSLAVSAEHKNLGIGSAIVKSIIELAQELKIPRIFTLTLEDKFFTKLGFKRVSKEALPLKVWSECCRCPKQEQCDEIALTINV